MRTNLGSIIQSNIMNAYLKSCLVAVYDILSLFGHPPKGSLCFMARFRSALRFTPVFLPFGRHHFTALMQRYWNMVRQSARRPIYIGIFFMACFLPFSINAQSTGDDFLEFLKAEPNRASMLLQYNDEVLAAQEINRMMPLASTVKIIIAIEYAHQCAEGRINPEEWIDLSALDIYFVPFTDGNAHPSWLQQSAPFIQEERIQIKEIVKGMIIFSSNANTDWLLNRLGIDKVNKRLESLRVTAHTPIYPIVSALFIGKELFPELKGKELQDSVRAVSSEIYIQTAHVIHHKLQSDPEYKKDWTGVDFEMQRIWSDRLPASNVLTYVALMQKLNSKTFLVPQVHEYLDDVLEYVMKNPANQTWLKHAGMKGGSTAFVLTKALYSTDLEGNRIELAYFLNDLTLPEVFKWQRSMNDFELKTMGEEAFRAKIKNTFSGQ